MGMFVRGRVAITVAGVTDEKDLTPETNVIFIAQDGPAGHGRR